MNKQRDEVLLKDFVPFDSNMIISCSEIIRKVISFVSFSLGEKFGIYPVQVSGKAAL